MVTSYGYKFYFKIGSDVYILPITPSELSIKVGSNNKVVTLISEGDINILKSPSLIEVEFEARFPMRHYPFNMTNAKFEVYFKKFKELKEKKIPFRFVVARETPDRKRTWDTNLLVALESMELNESVNEGDDVLITFKLKQFKEYKVKEVNPNNVTRVLAPSITTHSTSTSKVPRSNDNKTKSSKTHTVKKGDCLWNIAKKYYGKGSKWDIIYKNNKSIIESTAKKYGKKSSSNGHWIYPGTRLVIPAL